MAMKMLRYIPTLLTFNLIIGIIIGYYIKLRISLVVALLLLFFILVLVSFITTNKSYKQNMHFTWLSFGLFICIGITSITIHDKRNYKNHYIHLIDNAAKVKLLILQKVKPNKYYDKYVAQVLQVNNKQSTGRVLINVIKDTLKVNKLTIGDELYVNATLKEINKPLNPFQFNYKNYLEKQQIHHQIKIKHYFLIKHHNTLAGFIDKIHLKINNSLKNYPFKKDEIAIINALVLGDRSIVSNDLIQNYIHAGAIHILAVSGLHIGIIYLLFQFLFAPLNRLKNGKLIKALLIIFILWLYAFLAGLSPSIVRAVTMFTAISIGDFINKKTSTLHSLIISMFVLLLIHPLYLFSVGFQLSYMAVFSIVHFYPLFTKLYYPSHKLVRYFYSLFAVSFAAQIGILPLSLYYFHQFPSLFFVSSMIVIPFLGVVLGLGFIILILAVSNSLPLLVAKFYGFLIHLMNLFITFIAKQELFLIKNIHFSISMLLASYLFIILFYQFLIYKKYSFLKFTLLGVIIFQSVLIAEKYQSYSNKKFIIFNQKKNSIFLNKRNNHMMFYSDDSLKNNIMVTNYLTRIGDFNYQIKPIPNVLKIGNNHFLIVDSLGIYLKKPKNSYVVLKGSPKINLERLINYMQPKQIIADATNYKNYKKQWQKTCDSLHVKYYDTSISGAFVLDYK